MNLYRCDTEKSLEFQLGRSTAGTHRRGAPLSLQDCIFVIIIIGKVADPLCWVLALISKSVFGLHPKNGVFENEIEETTKLSFFFSLTITIHQLMLLSLTIVITLSVHFESYQDSFGRIMLR